MPQNKISSAKVEKFGKDMGFRQVVVIGFDGEQSSMLTWGASVNDKMQASLIGKTITRVMGSKAPDAKT